MTEGSPTLTLDGAIATLTLHRPSVRNSLNDDDLHTLLAHFDAINRHTAVQVVVLRADTTATTWAVLTTTPCRPCFLRKFPKP
jgi:enoyl-CoA hydratase/carnithine racemase